MHAIIPGTTYALNDLEGDGCQTVKFVSKEYGSGTTNEEVLSMLIDRVSHLQSGLPCKENAMAITKLEEALLWLNSRTADRRARGVWKTEKP